MNCSNCADEALYIYDPRGALATYFCGVHLPSFLQKSAKAGLLKTTEHFGDVRASALADLRPAPVEPLSVDGDETAEEPAPPPRRRRRPTKKAADRVVAPSETEDESVEESVANEDDSES